MLHRASDASQPMLSIGTVELAAAVGEGELQYAAEGALIANHTVVASRRNNFVAPPAGCNLGCEDILTA